MRLHARLATPEKPIDETNGGCPEREEASQDNELTVVIGDIASHFALIKASIHAVGDAPSES